MDVDFVVADVAAADFLESAFVDADPVVVGLSFFAAAGFFLLVAPFAVGAFFLVDDFESVDSSAPEASAAALATDSSVDAELEASVAS